MGESTWYPTQPGEIALHLRRKFILGGNATFTVVSHRTQKHLTYQVKKHSKAPVWFVRYKGHDTIYLGCIKNNRFKRTANSVPSETFDIFKWLWEHLQHKKVTILHTGSCGRCGRELTTPESIKSGFGPTCIKKI